MANKLSASEAFEKIAAEAEKLQSSDSWKRYLNVFSQSYDYSYNNLLLALSQIPEGTHFASYSRWKAMGRQVSVKGGAKILFPRARKIDTGEVDDKGEPVYEYQQSFGWGTIFDISQTEIVDEEAWAHHTMSISMSGDIQSAIPLIEQAISHSGFELRSVDSIDGSALGLTDYLNDVVSIVNDIEDEQRFRVLLHELGHILLQHGNDRREIGRARREVEADSFSYVVGTALGIDIDPLANSRYLAGWATQSDETSEDIIKNALNYLTKVVKDTLALIEEFKVPQEEAIAA